MRNLSVGSAVALTLMGAACSFHIGSDSRPPPQAAPPPAAPPPPGYAPPPAAAPQNQGQRPTISTLGRGRAPAAPPQAPPQVYPAAPTHIAPSVAAFPEAINIASIQAIANRNPKACGFVEVAPGVWTRVDCHAYAPAQRAIAHLSPRKALAVATHTAQWRPHRFFAAGFQQAMSQGYSKGIFPRAQTTTASPQAVTAPPPVVTAEGFPNVVDHRALNLEGPIKDQGPVGACTAFSLSSTLDNAAIRAGKMQPGAALQATSANHVWAAYGYPQMGSAADANLGRTISTMSIWGQSHSESCKIANPIIGDCGSAVTPPVVAGTFRADPALVAKSNRADASAVYKIASFEKLETQPVRVEQLLQTLASGADLWVAFKIDGFTWSSSKMRNGVIPDWTETNGGHAVTMSGYRETPQGRQYLIHNSWGPRWGEGGYAWVSEAMVQKWMHYAYRVKLADGDKAPDVTDDDCGADELVDVLTGRCSLICPDNSRPSNGCLGTVPSFPGLPPLPNFPYFGR